MSTKFCSKFEGFLKFKSDQCEPRFKKGSLVPLACHKRWLNCSVLLMNCLYTCKIWQSINQSVLTRYPSDQHHQQCCHIFHQYYPFTISHVLRIFLFQKLCINKCSVIKMASHLFPVKVVYLACLEHRQSKIYTTGIFLSPFSDPFCICCFGEFFWWN